MQLLPIFTPLLLIITLLLPMFSTLLVLINAIINLLYNTVSNDDNIASGLYMIGIPYSVRPEWQPVL